MFVGDGAVERQAVKVVLSLRGTYRLSTLTMDGIGFVTEYVPQPFICGTPSETIVKKRSSWWPFS